MFQIHSGATAGEVWLKMASMFLITDSLHVYEKNISAVQTRRAPVACRNEDSLMLGKVESDHAFRDLELATERIIGPSSDTKELMTLAKNSTLPAEYANYLYVLIAEGLRRRRNRNLAREVIGLSANPALSQLWRNGSLGCMAG